MSTEERHLLPDLKERLPGFGSPATIRIAASQSEASTREGQLLLWMLVNLLVRMKGVIARVELSIPPGLPLKPRIIPFPVETGDFASALLEASKACARGCEVVAESRTTPDVLFLTGNCSASTSPRLAVRVSCNGWLAFVGKGELPTDLSPADSPNPFGAFTAACIAAGEAFKFLGGMRPKSGKLVDSLRFSSFTFSEESDDSVYSNPPFVAPVDFGHIQVVGCGAVGNAFCHVLFSLEDSQAALDLIDRTINELGESELIEENNLSRYVMLCSQDVGKPKATTLAKRIVGQNPKTTAFDDGFQVYVSKKARMDTVLSCVDNDYARHAIQDQLPRVEFGASTFLMAAQLSFFDLASGTPCLKCYNVLEHPDETDDEIRNRLLSLPPDERAREASRVGVDMERFERLLQGPECGQLDPISVQKFALLDAGRDWAVGFVSVMSGIMLAAELFMTKHKSSGLSRRLLDGKKHTDMYFNFWYDNCTFTKSLPNPSCWCNETPVQPRRIYSSIWMEDEVRSSSTFKLADPKHTPEQRERLKLLDSALLFISSVLLVVGPILLLARGTSLPTSIQYAPVILFTVLMPLYVGYMRGAVELDSVIERIRGWEYLFVGIGAILIQATLTTILQFVHLSFVSILSLLYLVGWLGAIVFLELLLSYFAGRGFVSWFLQMTRGTKAVEIEEGIALVGTASAGFLVSLYVISLVAVGASGLVLPLLLWLLVLLLIESNSHRYLHRAGARFATLRKDLQANTAVRYYYWVSFLLAPGRIHMAFHRMIIVGLVLVIAGAVLPVAIHEALLMGNLIELGGIALAFGGAVLHVRAP